MSREVDFDDLDESLARCGATWNAAQAHGLLCARLAVDGAEAIPAAIDQVLEGCADGDALRKASADMLVAVAGTSLARFRERQSAFKPVLPDDAQPVETRVRALADWSESYLHGIVSGDGTRSEALRARLAREPVADIVRDLLQITRAAVDPDAENEDDEESYTEIVEYLRVAAQFVYEELADVRQQTVK